MSKKAVDKFFLFLNDHQLTKLTPAAFTQSEIITYADQNHFHFTKEALDRKIHDLQHSDGSGLNEVETAWKQAL